MARFRPTTSTHVRFPVARLRACCLLLLLAINIGCSSQSVDTKASASKFESSRSNPGLAGHDSEGSISGKSNVPQESIANRKIIYTAKIAIIVENFDLVESQIKAMVRQYNGYVADANLGRMQGERRSGTWTIRVPVEHFESLLDSASSIGVPTSRSQNSEDVTEEFVDVQARISNKKKLEERIVLLLERPDDKIQHVIEVERELARIREDIERMEGRIRYLSDRIALTTVTISVTEEKEYTPPQAPTYTNRLSKAWATSLDNAQRFFANTSIFIVYNAIPILAWIIVLTIGWTIYRRYQKRRRQEL